MKINQNLKPWIPLIVTIPLMTFTWIPGGGRFLLMNIEEQISKYLIRCAKFEFSLICHNKDFAKLEQEMAKQITDQKVIGIEWSKLAQVLEEKSPFVNYNFENSGFKFLKQNSPQFLTITKEKDLKWDSDEPQIDNWSIFLTRSFAQLRNNIAHGNKSQKPAPFTQKRTEQFIDAGNSFMDFVGKQILGNENWEEQIFFMH